MSGGPAKTRIEAVEMMLNGKIDEGSLSSRLEALANIAFTDGVISVESVTLPKDSVIKVEFTEELSSREDKAGEPVHFKIADNVYVNDVLVLPKGALGEGTIKKVVQPRSFGRDARIDVDFTHVYALDGTKVPVYIGDLAKQEAKTAAGAAGAAIGGMIVLGPIGALGGAFVTGKAVCHSRWFYYLCTDYGRYYYPGYGLSGKIKFELSVKPALVAGFLFKIVI